MSRASDRHIAASLSCVGHSNPFALGSGQRVLLSTASGSGGETAKEGGEVAAVHAGTQDDDDATTGAKASGEGARGPIGTHGEHDNCTIVLYCCGGG